MDRSGTHANRGLHVAFGVTVALVTVIAALGWSPWSSRWPAFVMLGVLALAYAAYGWRGYARPRAAAGFVPVLVVAALVLPAVVPSTAFVQCILFPVAWCQLDRVRTSVAVSVVIGVASGIGLQIASGPAAVVSTLLIETVSVAGACALGLWITRIAQLSDERRVLLEQLQATQASLAEAHRTAGITSERERLARELHDTVAQDLAGIVMLTERARGDLAAHRTDRLDERLAVLEESARTALEGSRTLVAAGAAGVASDGLCAALHRLGERFHRETGIPVEVDASDSALDRDVQVVLLRVGQEALANVRAHARAESVQMRLRTDADRVTLRVVDDGVGFEPARATAGRGLPGLRDRLTLAGGTCTVTSAHGSGTVVEAALPLQLVTTGTLAPAQAVAVPPPVPA
ncbi:two-component sensor histidine kinase [Curtobacterium citreum]|uniref:histidine kinase n=1 Tax=Curtobacterium citreum TaxID=2036 RepID=A0ABT2HLU2_9MICO|nr:sensor histidine kinase [Curtobacterium citreum]MCS6524246.1 sensor histidine kinase [Curtobacterium citreum]TQJ27558.1 signal transduction histidine kinase [Curtobacterium citreum]GGL91883.1 two-component sensor histidine kinase [Curtobacterium citreum]